MQAVRRKKAKKKSRNPSEWSWHHLAISFWDSVELSGWTRWGGHPSTPSLWTLRGHGQGGWGGGSWRPVPISLASSCCFTVAGLQQGQDVASQGRPLTSWALCDLTGGLCQWFELGQLPPCLRILAGKPLPPWVPWCFPGSCRRGNGSSHGSPTLRSLCRAL